VKSRIVLHGVRRDESRNDGNCRCELVRLYDVIAVNTIRLVFNIDFLSI
jgi:hypothetical protein